MIQRMVLLGALLIAAPAGAVELQDVQGGCEPSLAGRLVRQSSAKLDRCGATGQIIAMVSEEGRVERVMADVDTRPCLMARMAQWHLKMRERSRCTLHMLTQSAVVQHQAAVEAIAHPKPVPPPPDPHAGARAVATPLVAPPLVAPQTVKNEPAEKPAAAPKTHGAAVDKKAKKLAAIAAKKAALAAKQAAAKQKRADKVAAIKAAREAKKANKHAKLEKHAAKKPAKAPKAKKAGHHGKKKGAK